MIYTAQPERIDGARAWHSRGESYATRLVRTERVLASRELDVFVRKARHEETDACVTGRCSQCEDILAIAERVGRFGSVELHPMHPPLPSAQ